MGFKSSVATAQTTRFKRFKRPSAVTPPATPFNNTSFLIHLQRLRENYNSRPSPTRNVQFDQYGSMENMIASSFATPAASSPQNHSSISGLHTNQSGNHCKECSQNSECSTPGQSKSFDAPADARNIITCDTDHYGIPQSQLSSGSDDASSTVTEQEIEQTDPEMHEGDHGMLATRHRHRQHHFEDDNFDPHAQDSGSTGSSL